MTVRRTTLDSGLRVVTEHLAHTRSASIGVWVGAGSRHETAEEHGCSHFLEHVLFKGTPTRSAFEISHSLESVGGEFNAFTAKELTCFHAGVVDEDLPLAIAVLGDMICSSTLTAQDIDAEREVILDEIAMHEDDPDDVAHNLLSEAMWGAETALGRSIAGSHDSIEQMSRERVLGYYERHYCAENMVVSVAGNVEHHAVVDQVAAAFESAGRGRGSIDLKAPDALIEGARIGASRPTEQVTTLLAVPGIARTDARRYALAVLNVALGGGTASRLFQEVRERHGLAYSVYSFLSSNSDSGAFGVAAGCLPKRADRLVEVIRAELADVAAGGFTQGELDLGKGQLRGGLVLGLEDSGSRMSRLGKAELVGDELPSIDELIQRINTVTLDEVHEVARHLLTGPQFLITVGPQ